jgi:hypothetical protein
VSPSFAVSPLKVFMAPIETTPFQCAHTAIIDFYHFIDQACIGTATRSLLGRLLFRRTRLFQVFAEPEVALAISEYTSNGSE